MKKIVKVQKRDERHAPVRRFFGQSPVWDLQREINRMFDNFFTGFSPAPVGRWAESSFMPKLNVTEGEKEVSVSAELPGMDEKDMEVKLSRGLLTIRGEKKMEKEDKGKNYYYREQSSGSFHREVALPAGLNEDKAQAVFTKGVLTVSIPKQVRAVAEGKKIPIKNQ